MAGIHNMILGNSLAAIVQLTNQTLYDARAAQNSSASSIYSLNSDGTASVSYLNGPGGTLERWVTNDVASNYDCYATLNSGTLTAGTLNSWGNLASTRTWGVSASVGSTGTVDKIANITIQIRNASTLTVLATATISLEAAVGSGI